MDGFSSLQFCSQSNLDGKCVSANTDAPGKSPSEVYSGATPDGRRGVVVSGVESSSVTDGMTGVLPNPQALTLDDRNSSVTMASKKMLATDLLNDQLPAISPDQVSYTTLERKAFACYLHCPVVITSKEELEYLLKMKVTQKKWLLEHTSSELLSQLLSRKFVGKYELEPGDIPQNALTIEIALELLQRNGEPWSFDRLSPLINSSLINEFTQQSLDKFMPDASDILYFLPIGHEMKVDYKRLVFHKPSALKYVPFEHQIYSLCVHAICQSPEMIAFVDPERKNYSDLLKVAQRKLPYEIYRYIPSKFITENMICRAESKKPLDLACTPEAMRTYDRCKRAIQYDVKNIKHVPASLFAQHPDLLESGMHTYETFSLLPKALKTESICKRFFRDHQAVLSMVPQHLHKSYSGCVKQNLEDFGTDLKYLHEDLKTLENCSIAIKSTPESICYVPPSVLEKNPSLAFMVFENIDDRPLLKEIPDRLKTIALCVKAIKTDPKNIEYVPEDLRYKLPASLLLTVAPEYLPINLRQALLVNIGADYSHRFTPEKYLDKDEILKPIKPSVGMGGVQFNFSVFLKSVLLTSPSFNFRNQSMGHQLQQYIQKKIRQEEENLNGGNVIERPSIPENYSVYGGRALLSTEGNHCVRLKFLREGEPFSEFVREEAMHCYSKDNEELLNLKSEVPEATGLRLLAEENMPKELITSFRSTLKILKFNQKRYYLAYEFTTHNKNYSKLAHQPDENGHFQAAESGLLKACYDLGIWSSLGVVHTSTIMAFHFGRKEIFLAYLVNKNLSFPGALTNWDSRATDESDWGYTGLRDIGDVEFYPHITSYFQAVDVKYVSPGYSQRVAFINAFCENMIAAVMHYARLHRDDPDYHYKNQAGLDKLAGFVEKAINAYLSGLLGRDVKMSCFFESSEVYKEWLDRMARETAMWTARQDQDKDCFASHLNKFGSYPPEVYPDSKNVPERYPQNFTTNGKDNLGNNNSQFALTLLVRGLYQVSAGLAMDELSKSSSTDERMQ